MSLLIYPETAYQYHATLIRCVDGDTVDLEVDLGFYTFARIRFRLAGIDTPERGQPGYREATEYLRSLLEDRPIAVLSTKTGKYGRWLAELFTDNLENTSVNQAMVEVGHAREYR